MPRDVGSRPEGRDQRVLCRDYCETLARDPRLVLAPGVPGYVNERATTRQ